MSNLNGFSTLWRSEEKQLKVLLSRNNPLLNQLFNQRKSIHLKTCWIKPVYISIELTCYDTSGGGRGSYRNNL